MITDCIKARQTKLTQKDKTTQTDYVALKVQTQRDDHQIFIKRNGHLYIRLLPCLLQMSPASIFIKDMKHNKLN